MNSNGDCDPPCTCPIGSRDKYARLGGKAYKWIMDTLKTGPNEEDEVDDANCDNWPVGPNPKPEWDPPES